MNKGVLELVEMLLEAGANIKLANKKGETPLMFAHQHQMSYMAKMLIAPRFNKEVPLTYSYNLRSIEKENIKGLKIQDTCSPCQLAEEQSKKPRIINRRLT